jgi:hypothetical protein
MFLLRSLRSLSHTPAWWTRWFGESDPGEINTNERVLECIRSFNRIWKTIMPAMPTAEGMYAPDVAASETATHNIVSYGAGGIRFDFWYRAQAKSPA